MMERWGAGWRTRTWARWLRWTLIYTLMIYGIGILVEWVSMRVGPSSSDMNVQGWSLLAPPFLALLIGIWFRSWWWLLGPPVALLLPSFVGIIILTILVPDFPKDAGQASLLFLYLAVVSFIPSIVGVAIGKVWMRASRPVRRP